MPRLIQAVEEPTVAEIIKGIAEQVGVRASDLPELAAIPQTRTAVLLVKAKIKHSELTVSVCRAADDLHQAEVEAYRKRWGLRLVEGVWTNVPLTEVEKERLANPVKESFVRPKPVKVERQQISTANLSKPRRMF